MGTLKVDTIQDSGGNTILSSDGSGGFTNSLPAGKTSSFRNLIINGDMSIAQRGTSSSGVTGGGYTSVDRMVMFQGIGTFTFSQSTTVPTGQGFAKSFKADCTTAEASPGSADVLIFAQKIEGQNLQMIKKGTSNAEQLTASFWVRSNKTGTYTLEIKDLDNTRNVSQTYTINSADTWEKKVVTFPADTTGAFDNDNGASFQIHFWLGAGSDYTSGTLSTSWASQTNANRVSSSQVNIGDSTSNEWYITGVQLEIGTTASDFEFLPYDVNLKRCMRYYFNHYTPDDNGLYGLFTAHTTSAGRMPYRFIVPMRDAPTVSSSAASGFTWLGNNTSGNPSAIGSESLNKYSCTVNITGSFTQGYSYWLAGSTTTQLNFDAEL